MKSESALRIAVVGACPYPVPQGSQVYMRDTALALQRAGHDVRLVVYGYGLGQDSGEIPLRRLSALPFARKTAAGPSLIKPFYDIALAGYLREVVDFDDVQIVNAHNYEALAVGLLSLKRPLVYHAHNALEEELPYYVSAKRAAAAFGGLLDRSLPRRADHIIAPHERLADYLVQQGCRTRKITVIPPGMDTACFQTTQQWQELPPLLYAGNLDRYQNMDLLFEVLINVRSRIPQAELIVATAADPRRVSRFEKRARRKLGVEGMEGLRIVATPDFESVRDVLAQDAVFVCPRTSWSGYPIKLLNAMSSAKAVVCCESASHPIRHRHDGLVARDNDAVAFAEHVLLLLLDADLRRDLGRNARTTIETRHGLSATTESLAQVFSELSR